MLQRQPGVSIVGMGCSSFSNFFDGGVDESSSSSPTRRCCRRPDHDDGEAEEGDGDPGDSNEDLLAALSPSHPRVRAWIEAVRCAVLEASITVLDTAPWYGHGTSETVVGWALQSIVDDDNDDNNNDNNDDDEGSSSAVPSTSSSSSSAPTASTRTRVLRRSDLTINTKVGRYEADPRRQFDFTRERTLASVQRSLERLQIAHVDVLQLHDPEFAPSLDLLMNETIPALLHIQERGWCRRLGMTGYPLRVQRQLLDRTYETFRRNIWDQSLVYSHYNLHDTSLFYPPGRNEDNENLEDVEASSFAAYCRSRGIQVVTAAPLSMGLLTAAGPPPWHPASQDLKEACRAASDLCTRRGVDVSELATLFAMCHPAATCTIIGMKDAAQVHAAQRAATRVAQAVVASPAQGGASSSLSHEATLRRVLTQSEWDAYQALCDPVEGPFARVWESGTYQWDGVQCARDFWKHQLGIDQEPWQATADENTPCTSPAAIVREEHTR